MRRFLWLTVAILGFASAQQSATLSGIIKTEGALPEATRVAIHVVDSDNVWGLEVGSVVPVAGTFSISADPLPSGELRPFRSGTLVLPGLQNEYRVSPDDVNYAPGRVNVYVDNNGNQVFDRVIDNFFLGVASLENPAGFFSLIYVDKAATMTGSGVSLELQPGWNIFVVRPQEGGSIYSVHSSVEDAVLDVFLP